MPFKVTLSFVKGCFGGGVNEAYLDVSVDWRWGWKFVTSAIMAAFKTEREANAVAIRSA